MNYTETKKLFLDKQIEDIIASRFPNEVKAKRPEVREEEKKRKSINTVSKSQWPETENWDHTAFT